MQLCKMGPDSMSRKGSCHELQNAAKAVQLHTLQPSAHTLAYASRMWSK